jgi:hypothetical protein
MMDDADILFSLILEGLLALITIYQAGELCNCPNGEAPGGPVTTTPWLS